VQSRSIEYARYGTDDFQVEKLNVTDFFGHLWYRYSISWSHLLISPHINVTSYLRDEISPFAFSFLKAEILYLPKRTLEPLPVIFSTAQGSPSCMRASCAMSLSTKDRQYFLSRLFTRTVGLDFIVPQHTAALRIRTGHDIDNVPQPKPLAST